jgi:hypothetical protein
MEDNQVYVQGDFRFIKNDDLRKLFEKSYVNDNETKTNNSDMYSWARKKIDEKTDNCWKTFVDTFDEDALLEEYNDKPENSNFTYVNVSKKEPIRRNDGEIIIPIEKKGGKRKTRKTQKSRKPRRKTRKNKKTKKTKKSKK